MSTGAVARKNAAAYTDAVARTVAAVVDADAVARTDAAARTISVDALRG